MASIRGGCLCGAVRYASEAEPLMVAVCHCATCQKNTGSAFSINIGLPVDSVTARDQVLVVNDEEPVPLRLHLDQYPPLVQRRRRKRVADDVEVVPDGGLEVGHGGIDGLRRRRCGRAH